MARSVMESGSVVVGSFRESLRRYSDAFSGGSARGDDEEALMRAALEKLPVYERLRKGILRDDQGDGEVREIDVGSLSMEEKRRLLERLVKVVQEDNESFLLKLKDSMDRFVDWDS